MKSYVISVLLRSYQENALLLRTKNSQSFFISISTLPLACIEPAFLIDHSHMFKALKEIYQDRDDENIQLTRDRNIVEIRKSKRQEQFNRRRQKIKTDGKEDLPRCEPNNIAKEKVLDARYQQEIKMLMKKHYSRQMFPELSSCLQSEDLITVHRGVIGLRKVIFRDKGQQYIQEVIGLGVVDQIISFIKLAQYPQIQFEAAWIMVNLLFGSDDQCTFLVESGAFDAFIEICSKCEREETIQHVIWGIGNACETDISIPSTSLQSALLGLQQFCSRTENGVLIQHACWAMQAIIRKQISPSARKRSIAYLCCLIANDCIFDKEILHRCLTRISQNCLQKKGYQIVSIFKNSNVLPKIMSFLGGENRSWCFGARRIVGNLAAHQGPACDLLFENNVLDYVVKLLWSQKQKIRKDACWIYSNLALGNQNQVMKIIQNKKTMDRLFEMLLEDYGQIKGEIIFILAHLSRSCEDFDIQSLFMKTELFDIIVDLLDMNHELITLQTLQNLYIILDMAQRRGNHEQIIAKLQENGGVDLIDQLQENESYNAKAMQILAHFFGFCCFKSI